ncbi:related to cholinesterase [Fusarium oxysporum]|uniref:Carboxylic ester hydrolase n=1 Tax=Fusarium oxysporum TaxID=5507 RepID=A0A2H3T252_FUSOX|nr:related to cholinesterase [Fusarium oxysporum]
MLATAAILIIQLLASVEAKELPVVDLGYALYRAADFNQTGRYYNFSNIRYAAPPLGDLRFRAPVLPSVNRSIVQTGLDERICPQAKPAWMAEAYSWLLPYLAKGIVPNSTAVLEESRLALNVSSLQHRDPLESEDCLFLDVIVPQRVFENAGRSTPAPVMVYIHGGGYIQGAKTEVDPRGLLYRSRNITSDGIIFISLNYRLGAFGFSSGPTFQKDGTPNAALLDQRMALEWVQKNIHIFGGDKHRVTVFGGSAGAGSLIHQITAYGGEDRSSPFQQAIPQSPGWMPKPSFQQQETLFREFLAAANVSSLADARELPTEDVIYANALQIGNAPYGSFGYSPVIDGDFVRNDPRALFDLGRFDRTVRVMIGHNPNEGLGFAPPSSTNTEYLEALQVLFPLATSSTIDYIANKLYPPLFNGTSEYTDQIRRLALTVTEAVFTCTTSALGRGYAKANGTSYSYLFNDTMGLHGTDSPFVFYNAETSTLNQTKAYTLQDYILNFAVRGYPDSDVDGLERPKTYGENGTIVEITSTGIFEGVDPADNDRCRWWQLGLYQ